MTKKNYADNTRKPLKKKITLGAEKDTHSTVGYTMALGIISSQNGH